ncbi:MAG TPA: hypothetical protein VEC06_10835 [Paucimonas sp.]|nr:hypothetical protein [Paucimonas sp.]
MGISLRILSRLSPFTRDFLLMFSGPLIWAAHLLAIYVLAALACARGFAHVEWLGIGVVPLWIGILSVAALAGIAGIAIILCRTNDRLQDRRDDAAGSQDFMRWTTLTLAGISAVAIVWEAAPAYMVPVCG